MGIVVIFPRHAQASSRKSSTDTRFFVANLTAAAKSLDSQLLPLRKRDTVERSHVTPIARMREAIASSSKPSSSMNFERCMEGNVPIRHMNVNTDCALCAVALYEGSAHNPRMAKAVAKLQLDQPHERAKTFLKEWRVHKRLTQSKVAEGLGYVDHTMVSKIERGVEPYTQDFLEYVSRLYGASIWQLLYCPPNAAPDEVVEIWRKTVVSR